MRILRSIRACRRRASTTENTTQQYNTAKSAVHKAARQVLYVAIRARQRKQADRVGESQYVVEHVQLAVLSERAKKKQYSRPSNVYNRSQAADVMRE